MSSGETSLDIQLDASFYPPTVVQKAAYRLAHSFSLELSRTNESTLVARLVFSEPRSETALAAVRVAFFRELLDQSLREKLADETRDVRAVILAQAFSRVSILRDE